MVEGNELTRKGLIERAGGELALREVIKTVFTQPGNYNSKKERNYLIFMLRLGFLEIPGLKNTLRGIGAVFGIKQARTRQVFVRYCRRTRGLLIIRARRKEKKGVNKK